MGNGDEQGPVPHGWTPQDVTGEPTPPQGGTGVVHHGPLDSGNARTVVPRDLAAEIDTLTAQIGLMITRQDRFDGFVRSQLARNREELTGSASGATAEVAPPITHKPIVYPSRQIVIRVPDPAMEGQTVIVARAGARCSDPSMWITESRIGIQPTHEGPVPLAVVECAGFECATGMVLDIELPPVYRVRVGAEPGDLVEIDPANRATVSRGAWGKYWGGHDAK